MGTLSQTLQTMGVKGDAIGLASSPNMVIPSPSEAPLPSDIPIVVESPKPSDTSSIKSNATTNTTASSIHPGNSVWLDHSY